jgi:hypothetical protein
MFRGPLFLLSLASALFLTAFGAWVADQIATPTPFLVAVCVSIAVIALNVRASTD